MSRSSRPKSVPRVQGSHVLRHPPGGPTSRPAHTYRPLGGPCTDPQYNTSKINVPVPSRTSSVYCSVQSHDSVPGPLLLPYSDGLLVSSVLPSPGSLNFLFLCSRVSDPVPHSSCRSSVTQREVGTQVPGSVQGLLRRRPSPSPAFRAGSRRDPKTPGPGWRRVSKNIGVGLPGGSEATVAAVTGSDHPTGGSVEDGGPGVVTTGWTRPLRSLHPHLLYTPIPTVGDGGKEWSGSGSKKD